MTIEPKDQPWLSFLFYADGVNRIARYCWFEKRYFRWFILKAYVYIIFYPIIFIWTFCRKLRIIWEAYRKIDHE
jgi:surface polysaccharide O-acyltransferase-like enzyme